MKFNNFLQNLEYIKLNRFRPNQLSTFKPKIYNHIKPGDPRFWDPGSEPSSERGS